MGCLSDVKQVIVVRNDLNMRKGKIAAQVAHASNMFLFSILKPDLFPPAAEFDVDKEEILQNWIQNDYKKIVVGCSVESELKLIIQAAKSVKNILCFPVYDLGLTEFHGNLTLTCASFGPAPSESIDPLTKHLKLI